MFRKRFAFQFEGHPGAPWRCADRHGQHGQHEHGPPAWHGHHGPGWRLWGLHMRRKFFGPGGPFGPGEPFDEEAFPGFPGRGKRFFGRGDLKYALLELLQERPMHGYEMMKALQERSSGRYTASAGSVYPTLQMLDDRGFVTVSEVDGKKVYTITDAGRAFLAEGRSEERGGPGRRGFGNPPDDDWNELSALVQELHDLRPLLGQVWHSAVHDPRKLKRLRKLLGKLRAELADIVSAAGGAED